MGRAWSRTLLLAAIICLPSVAGEPSGRGGADGDLWLTGDVVVHADTALQTIVVTVDAEPPDGVVDAAFRVQQPDPLVSYHGLAGVEYASGQLVITPLDGPGQAFGFAVSPGDAALATAAGISRFWGAGIHVSVEEVQAALLASFCGGSDPQPPVAGCDPCDVGGPGSSECEIPADSSCEAFCAVGYFACCNYPADCRCCKDIERP